MRPDSVTLSECLIATVTVSHRDTLGVLMLQEVSCVAHLHVDILSRSRMESVYSSNPVVAANPVVHSFLPYYLGINNLSS